MELEGSLPHSQQPATCPYPEPARPSPHSLKVHFNIILPSTPGFPKWSFSSGFPNQSLHTPPHSSTRVKCPTHFIILDFITQTILGEQYRSFSSSLCSSLHSPVTSSHLTPNILLNTIFSNTLSLRFSLNVSDQVSHPFTRQATDQQTDINTDVVTAIPFSLCQQSQSARALDRGLWGYPCQYTR